MKIEDNFLKQEEFDKIRNIMTHGNFPWFFRDRYYEKIGQPLSTMEPPKPELDKFQFVHAFYDVNVPVSSYMEHLDCILQLIQPMSIIKIRANLLTRLPSIVENPLHTDLTDWPEEKIKQWTTSIFYVNTNNGYTKFEDGTKFESVANRMVTFQTNMKHTGTSCTDEKIRVVINFNYFSKGESVDDNSRN